ncbi:MAG: threonine synthase [Succinivibrionaceae bacterium]|nr:threonine synthase [Succinivibrionaceae bacterium]
MELCNLKDPAERASFATAVRRGIGHGQGLFFFTRPLEPIPGLDGLLDMPFVPRSQRILRHLIGDEIPSLEDMVADAFSFGAPPVVPADDHIHALELFHGPTLAFKDFGARFMARALGAIRGDAPLTILTATSGDTGAAVAAAFYGQPGIEVVILYPRGKISALQEKLMSTLGGNIHAVSVEGTFDQCQDLVKASFDDQELREAVGLNSANSINISRLLAQVTYYFEAAAQLRDSGRRLLFSVPCGNFGDLTAGLIARALGLNARFAIACNANDTVPRYLRTGRFEPRPTVATLSNAMDISRPNNWPRVEALAKLQGWSLGEFACGSLSDDETRAAMRSLYQKTGYVLEPHAAIAWSVLAQHRRDDEEGVFLGTAHPAKFKSVVDATLGIDLPLPGALASRAALEGQALPMQPDFAALRQLLLSLRG